MVTCYTILHFTVTCTFMCFIMCCVLSVGPLLVPRTVKQLYACLSRMLEVPPLDAQDRYFCTGKACSSPCWKGKPCSACVLLFSMLERQALLCMCLALLHAGKARQGLLCRYVAQRQLEKRVLNNCVLKDVSELQDFKLNVLRWHLLPCLGKLLFNMAQLLSAPDYKEHYRRDLGPAALHPSGQGVFLPPHTTPNLVGYRVTLLACRCMPLKGDSFTSLVTVISKETLSSLQERRQAPAVCSHHVNQLLPFRQLVVLTHAPKHLLLISKVLQHSLRPPQSHAAQMGPLSLLMQHMGPSPSSCSICAPTEHKF